MDELQKKAFLKEIEECPCCRAMEELDMGEWAVPMDKLPQRETGTTRG